MTTLRDAALAHAAKGYRVHPLRPGTKIAMLRGWPEKATTDKKQIKKWWAEYPSANVGIATGRASDLIVIDVDVKDGKNGAESLAALEAELGALPKCYRVETPSGGFHLYFSIGKRKGDFRNTVNLVPGVDVRADGGYVVAAPSTLGEGKAYEVARESAGVPVLSKPFAALTRRSEPDAHPTTSGEVTALTGSQRHELQAYASRSLKYLGAELANLAKLAPGETDERGRGWESGVFEIACRLIEFTNAPWSGLSRDQAFEPLTEYAPVDGNFGRPEIAAKWQAASKKVGKKAAKLPEIKSGGFVWPDAEEATGEDPETDEWLEQPTGAAALISERDRLGIPIEAQGHVASIVGREWAEQWRAERDAARNGRPDPRAMTLDERLRQVELPKWRIDGFFPMFGRLLLLAQRKTGKTTFVANLIRSLLTLDPFLGRFAVEPIEGNVMFLNFEMSGPTLDGWLRDLDFPADAQKRLVVMDLRGAANPFATNAGQQTLVETMRAHNVKFLVVDVFARAFQGEQNSNSEVAAFLGTLDRVATDGGADELVLVAHAGWGNAERARGASALEDWADQISSLSMDENALGSPRYLKSFGRDVELEKDRLDFDPVTRRLTLTGAGGPGATRKTEKARELAEPVLAIIARKPGVTAGAIEQELRESGVSFRRGEHSAAIGALVARGRVNRARDGQRVHHWLVEATPDAYRPDPEFVTPSQTGAAS